MIYERCLEERNSTLAALALNPLELTSLPPEGTIINVGNNETQIMPAIPECDLQKELDNVNILFHLSNQMAFLQKLTFTQLVKQYPVRFGGSVGGKDDNVEVWSLLSCSTM
jgi:hypothetical protein